MLSGFGIPVDDREDLVQQALLIYAHKRASVEDPEHWLLGTVRNVCRNYWRARRREILVAVDRGILDALAKTGCGPQELSDLRRDLEGAVACLPSRCRSLLELRYREDYPPKEAARELGYRPSGIYKVIERCLAALSRQLLASGFLAETGRA